ncbi:transcriptional regulator with XRE-family HTH domain [Natronobacillus azotifigens]|uniref:Helix-turn-helix domain containing protein n=1 Tax=Natronobacillus azotifigens TaxID=472978 RepID=A0A9J6RG29_9BACI|nr:helix-turn-helix domain-containing protein [Natronobacillus azotifigens]MCZ0704113.1 helix-turn-helix domain containing protein [Natronobacillus azotifigens]
MLFNKQQILSLYAEKKGKGITNKQLAQAVDLNPATISRWFNFKMNLSDQKE